MAKRVTVKGCGQGETLGSIVVDGLFEVTPLEFIAEAVNAHRKRANMEGGYRAPMLPTYRIRIPSRPEPELKKG